MPVVVKPNPFEAVLLSSPALAVTLEQQNLIRQILNKSCSDSRFAEKAYVAIWLVLTQGNAIPPVVTSLSPSSANIGDPSFILRVLGTGFTPASVIVFAGLDEPTTYVSDKEVTTGVNMDVWLGPDTLPVAVRNADGVQSDPASFEFKASTPVVLATKVVEKKEPPADLTKKGK